MNIKHIRNFFLIFIIVLMFYASYVIIFNDMTLKKETVSKSLIIGENEKVTTLKLGISEFDTINPILTNNKDIQYISKLLYDSLFTISKDYKIESCLGLEYNKISDKSYIIKLRQSVHWTNGDEFSAQDVIYTIEKIKSQEGIYSELVKIIESVQEIDKYTIKINLYEETTFFEYNLIFPIIKNNSNDEEFYNIGMYNIEEISDNRIVLSKNDGWWNKKNKEAVIKNININLYYNKHEEYKAFKESEIDILNTNNINYEEYIGKFGYNEKKYTSLKHTFLALNMENKFLSNQKVRQAINYAIDKETIVSEVYNNKYLSSNFPLDYGNFLYNDNIHGHVYSPQEASEILSQQFETMNLELNLIVKNTDEKKLKVAEIIKSDLENIGLVINIAQLDEKEYKECLNDKDYDLLLCTIDLSLSPNLEFFFSDNNIFNYNNTNAMQILKEISNINDQELLKKKYEELERYYFEDVFCVSLYNNVSTLIYSNNLRANVNPNYFNLFYGIEKWYCVKKAQYLG